MCLLFADSENGLAIAIVELKGAIAIAVVEHLAPSVFCVPETSDSDHDGSAEATLQVLCATRARLVKPSTWLLGAGISQ